MVSSTLGTYLLPARTTRAIPAECGFSVFWITLTKELKRGFLMPGCWLGRVGREWLLDGLWLLERGLSAQIIKFFKDYICIFIQSLVCIIVGFVREMLIV